jgi:hypothetical protein
VISSLITHHLAHLSLFTLTNPPTLIVAHPGHEVRLHGWLEVNRPRVFVLTDGSGRTGRSRLGATRSYLENIGSQSGSFFGRFTDQTIYQAILECNFDFFIGLANELSEALLTEPPAYVVGDAREGYNTTHDVCRLLINCAVERVNRSTGRQVLNYDYAVVNRPDSCPADLREQAIWLHLDEPTFKRKITAAQTFYPELLAEVEESLKGRSQGLLKMYLDRYSEAGSAQGTDQRGLEMFRTECLWPVRREWDASKAFEAKAPFYERVGERQVAAGHYGQVIRYKEHMLPLAQALSGQVEKSSSACNAEIILSRESRLSRGVRKGQ